jgi:tetratricopeptide (TPR) repeat protein
MFFQWNRSVIRLCRWLKLAGSRLHRLENKIGTRGSPTRVSQIIFLALLFCVLVEPAGGAQNEAQDSWPIYNQSRTSQSIPLTNPDEAFVRDAVTKYGSRKTASELFAARGWSLTRDNKHESALQHFIRAWQLNHKNYQAFWGFGAILSEQGKLAEAIEQLEMARELNEDSSQRVRLLTDLGILHSEYATRIPSDNQLDRAHRFILANSRFAESLEIDPDDAASWRAWAISLDAQERHSEAWIKAKRALDLNSEPFPAGFLERLREKMPQPE